MHHTDAQSTVDVLFVAHPAEEFEDVSSLCVLKPLQSLPVGDEQADLVDCKLLLVEVGNDRIDPGGN
jgi:hypothetical protein